MTINKELLQQTLQHIEDHPEDWQQADYITVDGSPYNIAPLPEGNVCGTAYCFAGWSCVLSGLQIDSHGWVAGGEFQHTAMVAQDLLGLSDWQSTWLFAGGNDLDDLRQHVKTLCDEGLVYSRNGLAG